MNAAVDKPPRFAYSDWWKHEPDWEPSAEDICKYFLSLQPHRLFPKRHSLQFFFV